MIPDLPEHPHEVMLSPNGSELQEAKRILRSVKRLLSVTHSPSVPAFPQSFYHFDLIFLRKQLFFRAVSSYCVTFLLPLGNCSNNAGESVSHFKWVGPDEKQGET